MKKNNDSFNEKIRLNLKHFSFDSSEKALIAYNQAREIVEKKFFFNPDSIVKISDCVVSVPDWFPYSPNPMLSVNHIKQSDQPGK